MLRDFAKLIAAGTKHFFFYKESAFTFSIESIISFSKCPEELTKAILYYLQPENLIDFDQIETKLTSEMEKQKPFFYAFFGLPKRSGLVCFHMMTFA